MKQNNEEYEKYKEEQFKKGQILGHIGFTVITLTCSILLYLIVISVR